MDIDNLKRQAAHRAVEFIQSGMTIGLGTGSTARFALERISELLRSDRLRNIQGVPSSKATAKTARALRIPLTSLDERPVLDLNIDGADEVDPKLNLIKGGGGALLREKVLAQASRRNVIIVDQSKLSPRLGTRWPLPVEVLPFAMQSVAHFLNALGAKVDIRRTPRGRLKHTDQANLILDADFGPIEDPMQLATRLSARAGVIAHGLFIGLAHDVIVAEDGGLRHLTRPPDLAV